MEIPTPSKEERDEHEKHKAKVRIENVIEPF